MDDSVDIPHEPVEQSTVDCLRRKKPVALGNSIAYLEEVVSYFGKCISRICCLVRFEIECDGLAGHRHCARCQCLAQGFTLNTKQASSDGELCRRIASLRSLSTERALVSLVPRTIFVYDIGCLATAKCNIPQSQDSCRTLLR